MGSKWNTRAAIGLLVTMFVTSTACSHKSTKPPESIAAESQPAESQPTENLSPLALEPTPEPTPDPLAQTEQPITQVADTTQPKKIIKKHFHKKLAKKVKKAHKFNLAKKKKNKTNKLISHNVEEAKPYSALGMTSDLPPPPPPPQAPPTPENFSEPTQLDNIQPVTTAGFSIFHWGYVIAIGASLTGLAVLVARQRKAKRSKRLIYST